MTNAALNKKAEDIENKIPDFTNLATKTALNTKPTEDKYLIPQVILLLLNLID